jgi:putative addiction module component (TIGR02574 family)
MTISFDDILKLTVSERLDLIEAIWESIADLPDALPVTEAQRQELDRRLSLYGHDRPRLSSWDEVRARLEDQE